MGRPAPFTVLELGAGNGLLCKDIITYANEMPEEFARAIRYICLDRRMPEVLEADLPNTSRILSDRLPFKQVVGCILSNEYLDAFPVHQIMMTKDGLKEIYVSIEQDNLVEVVDDLSELRIEKHFIDFGVWTPGTRRFKSIQTLLLIVWSPFIFPKKNEKHRAKFGMCLHFSRK